MRARRNARQASTFTSSLFRVKEGRLALIFSSSGRIDAVNSIKALFSWSILLLSAMSEQAFAKSCDQRSIELYGSVPGLSDFRPVLKADFNPDDMAIWDQDKSNGCPQISELNIGSPYFKVTAFLVVEKSGKKPLEKIVFIGKNFRRIYSIRDMNPSGLFVIWRHKPEKVDDISTGKKIDIKTDFLVAEYMEASSIAIYFEGRKFKTADLTE